MSNEHEPNIHDPAAEDIPFDDFESKESRQTLSEMLRNNPMLKIGLIVGVIAVVIGGMVLFGGKKGDTPVSKIQAKSDVNQTPGTEQVSDVYKKAVQETNAQAVEKAIKTGGSALPVPIAAPVGRVPLPETTASTEDPLERWRRMQEARNQQNNPGNQQAAQQQQQQQASNAQAVKDLANAMSTQMESVLKSVKINPLQNEKVTAANFLDPKETANGAGNGNGGNGAAATDTAGQTAKPVQIIVPAGTINYAQLVTEANSDVNGPILAVILGGPLAGDRVLGTFQKQNKFLVLKFDTVVIDGIGHPTDGVAIDPSTNTQALATDVDHHYFDRIILPAAAAFIQGLGSAIASTGSTVSQTDSSTVTSTPKLDVKQQVFAGISTGAQQAGQVLTQDGQQTQITIKVAAGTTMGILFTKPVTDQTSTQ